MQALPPPQSAAVQQLPAWHRPPQQTWPAPHWAASVQAWQEFPTQARPSQSAAPQQSPLTQAPSQQRWPPRQSRELPQAGPAGFGAGFGAETVGPGAETGRLETSEHAASTVAHSSREMNRMTPLDAGRPSADAMTIRSIASGRQRARPTPM